MAAELRVVKGHGLWCEGAPHDENGKRILHGRGYQGVGGEGRAACRCGALSEVLPSAYKRKQWHAVHKAEVASS